MRIVIIGVLLCLFLPVHADVPAVKPSAKQIILKPFTTLNVNLVPDMGTRFIFPFVLDQTDDVVPFTLVSTNPAFRTTRDEGRNFFVLEIDPPQGGGALPTNLGNVFVTAGGYNLSIVVQSTSDIRKQVSDYIFTLSDKAREDLIQTAIQKRSLALENAFKEKEASLNERADKLALKKIAILSMLAADNSNIKEETTLELPQGQAITVYMSDMTTYGKKFHVIHYEVTNETAEDLRILEVSLFTVDKNNIKSKINSVNKIRARIEVNETEEGWVSTDSRSVSEGSRLMLAVLTSSGEVDVRW